MTTKDAVKTMRKMKRSFLANLVQTERRTALHMMADARRLSSGTFKAHGEYSRNKPHRPLSKKVWKGLDRAAKANKTHSLTDFAIINKGKTGSFKSSWKRLSAMSWQGGKLRNTILNDSPHAKYMKGTKSMVERPIRQRLIERIRPVRAFYLKSAIKNTLRSL